MQIIKKQVGGANVCHAGAGGSNVWDRGRRERKTSSGKAITLCIMVCTSLTTLSCVSITPLGLPVAPEVQTMPARSVFMAKQEVSAAFFASLLMIHALNLQKTGWLLLCKR